MFELMPELARRRKARTTYRADSTGESQDESEFVAGISADGLPPAFLTAKA